MGYHNKSIGNWWLEYGFFNHHENMLLGLEIGPSRSVGNTGVWYNFMFGISLFYYSLFFFDLGYNRVDK